MIPLSIPNLCNGGLVERLHGEMRRAVENILDPNTEAKKARKVTLTITIKPNEHRNMAEVEQTSSSFIFRAKTGPRFALMEADGGAWRSKAMKNIKAFLEFEVKDLHVIA